MAGGLDDSARQCETVAPRGSDRPGAHGPATVAEAARVHIAARPGADVGAPPAAGKGAHAARVGAHAAHPLTVGDGHGTSGSHRGARAPPHCTCREQGPLASPPNWPRALRTPRPNPPHRQARTPPNGPTHTRARWRGPAAAPRHRCTRACVDSGPLHVSTNLTAADAVGDGAGRELGRFPTCQAAVFGRRCPASSPGRHVSGRLRPDRARRLRRATWNIGELRAVER